MPGMIVAPQSKAVEIGAQVLAEGGNAIDAAVTTAIAQGVLDPQMCGVGGFGSFNIFWAQSGVPKRGLYERRSSSVTKPPCLSISETIVRAISPR
jgi:gamma-glutamyltranspeptidase/glutathione hydrolase